MKLETSGTLAVSADCYANTLRKMEQKCFYFKMLLFAKTVQMNKMSTEYWCKDTEEGQLKDHTVPHKTCMFWSGIKPGPPM